MTIPLTARAPVEFTPPTLYLEITRDNDRRQREAEGGEVALREMVKIRIRVPTMFERDAFASMLVRAGVVHYSRSQIRELVLAGVTHLHPADQFDEMLSQLEMYWQAGDAMTEANERRRDKFIELVERNETLLPEMKLSAADIERECAKIQPSVVMDKSAHVRITAMQQDITSRYEPLQKAFADLAEQETKRAYICIQNYVTGWSGLDLQPGGNGKGGLLPHEAEWLRGQIGFDAFEELAGLIFAMHSLDKDEEKNLASLIESSSVPIGSTAGQESMSDPANEAGNSTDGSSTPTPGTGSPTTTDTSSEPTTAAKRKTARSKPTQTAKR